MVTSNRTPSLTVIVTGASSGIGAALARELHAAGHRVVLAARREDELQRLAHELSPAGHGVLSVPTDVTDPEQRARLIARTRDVFGPPDVLVNNAGVNLAGGRWWTKEHPTRVLDVNLVAAVELTRLVLPGMIERRSGHVVSVASVAGHVPTTSLYSASKFGIRGFTLSLRRELLGTGVHASVVSPGFVRTEMTGNNPLPMPGPEVVARAVSELLRRPRAEVVVPGWYRALIALNRTFPWLGDAAISAARRSRRRGWGT